MNKTPVTSLNAQRYAETFAVFVSRSHEYPAMIQRLLEDGKLTGEHPETG